jgi:hypothetical protein
VKWWQQLIVGAVLGVALAAAVVYGVIELTEYMMEFMR